MTSTGGNGQSARKAIHSPVKRAVARLVDIGLAMILKTQTGSEGPSPPGPDNPPRRILVAQLDHIGDTIMATPVFSSLRASYPHSHITALVGPWSAPLLEKDWRVDEVIAHAAPWFSAARAKSLPARALSYLSYLPAYVRLLRQLRAQPFDLGVELRGDLRHIALYLWVGACRYRVGLDRSGGRSLLHRAIRYQPGSHVVHNNLKLVKACGVAQPVAETSLFVAPDDRSAVRAKLRDAGLQAGQLFAVIHAGARTRVRRWPPERFAQVADWIIEKRQLAIVLAGSRDEADIEERVARSMRHAPVRLTGHTSIGETLALLSMAELVVCNESSLMHAAAALGRPTVAIYGPMEPEQTAPLNGRVRIVFERFECSPCAQNRCQLWHKSHGKCLDAIEPWRVQTAIRDLLAENQAGESKVTV